MDADANRMPPSQAQHGGDLDLAVARYGGARAEWIDLSTGINRRPYPVGELPAACWTALPDADAERRLIDAARAAHGAPREAEIIAAPGAQALIQLLPLLRAPGEAAVLSPTYSEHARAFDAAGWRVREIAAPEAADALVAVNPNNPDGRTWRLDTLTAAGAGLLIVDESFADVAPELSAVGVAGRPGLVVLRSFGKFFGLAGLRLGFAIADPATIDALAARLGPWATSGPALEIGRRALSDAAWIAASRARLRDDAIRLDALGERAGWRPLGGTDLFRLFDVGDSGATQDRLARARIWSRRFDYAPSWLRLGPPGSAAEWAALEAAAR